MSVFRNHKKTDFAKITAEQISMIEYLINSRPRKRHYGRTPYEVTGGALNS